MDLDEAILKVCREGCAPLSTTEPGEEEECRPRKSHRAKRGIINTLNLRWHYEQAKHKAEIEPRKLEIVPNLRAILVHGKQMQLSDVAFEFLSKLAKQPGKWLSGKDFVPKRRQTANEAAKSLDRVVPGMIERNRLHGYRLAPDVRVNIIEGE